MAAAGIQPPHGSVVPVTIPDDASHFKHRGEFVYLPPAWFAAPPPPQLPTVMMIGGEFNTPADWMRAGNAVKTIDDFAADPRRQRAGIGVRRLRRRVQQRHRMRQRPPRQRRRPPDQRRRAVHGSRSSASAPDRGELGHRRVVHGRHLRDGPHGDASGAVQHVRRHRRRHRAPNSGTKAQTIDRLFGGNAKAWAAFDPATVIAKHGPLPRGLGLVRHLVEQSAEASPQPHGDRHRRSRLGGQDVVRGVNGQAVAADSLCDLGRANGINCAVVAQPGKHDWPFADNAFAAALPWLAGRLGTPGVARTPLPFTWPPESAPTRHAEPVGR